MTSPTTPLPPPRVTGGGLPPERMTMMTGGPNPPATVTPPPLQTGGPNPPASVLPTSSPIGIMNWQSTLQQGNQDAQTREVGQNELVANQLNQLTGSDSQYIRQAEDRARSEASNRGMMFSTMAAGAGRRAAIDAALPIASQDATTYGRTASENMAAVNADRLQDQSIYGNLTGQEMGIRANLDESERARGFTSRENTLNRQFQTSERIGAQQFQTGERVGTQSWQKEMQVMQNAWQGAQNSTQRQHELVSLERQQVHDRAMRILDQNFQGSQLDKQLLQQRFLEFENAMQNQGNNLANTIASIYNNPNLSAAQQSAAVANARAVFQSIYTSYAQSLAGGLPSIFWQPYQMSGSASGGVNPPIMNPPPVVTPPPTGGGGGGGLPGGGYGGMRVGPMLQFTGGTPRL